MWSDPIKGSPVATVRHEPPFPPCLPYLLCPGRSILIAGSRSSMACIWNAKLTATAWSALISSETHVSAKLVGHHVSLQLDAKARCVHVYLEQQRVKSL